MRIEIINRVFSEFESEIKKGWQSFEMPINYPQEGEDGDCDEWTYGFDHTGGITMHSISALNGFIKYMCTNDSYCKEIGSRLFASIEYKRVGKGGNQPQRELFIGEILALKPSCIKMYGTISSFGSSIHNETKLTEIVSKLNDLDKEKAEFIKAMFNH